jgi:hypothetical protein
MPFFHGPGISLLTRCAFRLFQTGRQKFDVARPADEALRTDGLRCGGLGFPRSMDLTFGLLLGPKEIGAEHHRAEASSMRFATAGVLAIVAMLTSRDRHAQVRARSYSPVLPRPTGTHRAGTVTLHPVDASRMDPVSRKPDRFREIMVQVWYPADVSNGQEPAPYLLDQAVIETMKKESYYLQPSSILEGWKRVSTHSVLNAPVEHGASLYPLPVFSPDSGFPARITSLFLRIWQVTDSWLLASITLITALLLCLMGGFCRSHRTQSMITRRRRRIDFDQPHRTLPSSCGREWGRRSKQPDSGCSRRTRKPRPTRPRFEARGT